MTGWERRRVKPGGTRSAGCRDISGERGCFHLPVTCTFTGVQGLCVHETREEKVEEIIFNGGGLSHHIIRRCIHSFAKWEEHAN